MFAKSLILKLFTEIGAENNEQRTERNSVAQVMFGSPALVG